MKKTHIPPFGKREILTREKRVTFQALLAEGRRDQYSEIVQSVRSLSHQCAHW